MKNRLVLILAALLCIAADRGGAATTVIDPSDDAALYTCGGCNLISNGQYLLVGGYIQGAVKFPVAQISSPVSHALLSVNPYGLPLGDLNVDVYGFTSNSGLIDAQSANAGVYLGRWSIPSSIGFGQDTFFDVTNFVANAGGPYIGFNLRSITALDVFSSIEINYGHPAQLTVTVTPQAASPVPTMSITSMALLVSLLLLSAIWMKYRYA